MTPATPRGQSIRGALRALRVLMTGPAGVEQVAEAAECDRSTAYRLLTAFGDAGLPLERIERGSYHMDRGAFLRWLEGPRKKMPGR